MEGRYILVDFPEIQKYQDKEDFEDNSCVCTEIDGAYFVDEDWKNEIDSKDKTAKLVTFTITTRVVVNSDEGVGDVVDKAIHKICTACVENYICHDNVESVLDDTECPYGTYADEV